MSVDDRLDRARARLDDGAVKLALADLWDAYVDASRRRHGRAELEAVRAVAERARLMAEHDDEARADLLLDAIDGALSERPLESRAAEPSAPEPAIESAVRPRVAERPLSFWVAIAACVGMALGSFGTWARAPFGATVSGLEGDGWFILAAAAVGVLTLVGIDRAGYRAKAPLIITILAGIGGFAIVWYDGQDIFGHQSGDSDLLGDVDLIQPGWGLYMAGVGSAFLVVASIALAAKIEDLQRARR